MTYYSKYRRTIKYDARVILAAIAICFGMCYGGEVDYREQTRCEVIR